MVNFKQKLDRIFENPNSKLYIKLSNLKPQIANIVQIVYDKWDETNVDTYANGGICHLIADEINDFLYKHKIESYTHSLDYKQHVVTIAVDSNQKTCYMIDVPESIYETGGGFKWKKISDVVFEPDDIEISSLNYTDWSEPQEY